MTIHSKSAMILFATLALGILIGALSMTFYKDNIRSHRRPLDRIKERGGFFGLHERIIQPTSNAQADSIRQVLEQYFPKFQKFQSRHKDEIQALLDSLQYDLKPLLTEEQWQRIQERRERALQLMDKRGMGPGGPHNMGPDGMPPFPPPDFNRPPHPDGKPPRPGDRGPAPRK